jgi:hypothetical protein
MSRGAAKDSFAAVIVHLLITPRPSGVLLNSNFKMVCERPPAAFGGFPLTRGRICNLPLVRGSASEASEGVPRLLPAGRGLRGGS